MAEKEIKQEIEILKEEISAIGNELEARIGISKDNIITGLKFAGIGIASLIGLKLGFKILKPTASFLWKHKGAIILVSAGAAGLCMSNTSQCECGCGCSHEECSTAE